MSGILLVGVYTPSTLIMHTLDIVSLCSLSIFGVHFPTHKNPYNLQGGGLGSKSQGGLSFVLCLEALLAKGAYLVICLGVQQEMREYIV